MSVIGLHCTTVYQRPHKVYDYKRLDKGKVYFMNCTSIHFMEFANLTTEICLDLAHPGVGIWKSRKWNWNGDWKQKLERETGNGNRNGNATS